MGQTVPVHEIIFDSSNSNTFSSNSNTLSSNAYHYKLRKIRTRSNSPLTYKLKTDFIQNSNRVYNYNTRNNNKNVTIYRSNQLSSHSSSSPSSSQKDINSNSISPISK